MVGKTQGGFYEKWPFFCIHDINKVSQEVKTKIVEMNKDGHYSVVSDVNFIRLVRRRIWLSENPCKKTDSV